MDQVEDGDRQSQRQREGHAHDEQDDRARRSGDHGQELVAGHVARDGLRDLLADVAPARTLRPAPARRPGTHARRRRDRRTAAAARRGRRRARR